MSCIKIKAYIFVFTGINQGSSRIYQGETTDSDHWLRMDQGGDHRLTTDWGWTKERPQTDHWSLTEDLHTDKASSGWTERLGPAHFWTFYFLQIIIILVIYQTPTESSSSTVHGPWTLTVFLSYCCCFFPTSFFTFYYNYLTLFRLILHLGLHLYYFEQTSQGVWKKKTATDWK